MATALLDVWTEEKCLQLIRAYRARPILWDQKDPFFFKKNLKPIAWCEIGAAVDIPADQCKHKMIILMSSFRREKAKIVHSIKNSKDETRTVLSQAYKSTWFAFKEMAFLLDKESERKRQLNEDSVEIDEEDGEAATYKNTLLSHHLDPRSKRPRLLISVKGERRQSVTHTEQEESSVVQIEPSPGPSQSWLEREEEIKSFTKFIGNKMKKYSDTTKNAVQQAICDIIFKADQNYYDNTSYEKFTFIDEDTDPLNKQMLEDGTIIKIDNASDSE